MATNYSNPTPSVGKAFCNVSNVKQNGLQQRDRIKNTNDNKEAKKCEPRCDLKLKQAQNEKSVSKLIKKESLKEKLKVSDENENEIVMKPKAGKVEYNEPTEEMYFADEDEYQDLPTIGLFSISDEEALSLKFDEDFPSYLNDKVESFLDFL